MRAAPLLPVLGIILNILLMILKNYVSESFIFTSRKVEAQGDSIFSNTTTRRSGCWWLLFLMTAWKENPTRHESTTSSSIQSKFLFETDQQKLPSLLPATGRNSKKRSLAFFQFLSGSLNLYCMLFCVLYAVPKIVAGAHHWAVMH